jgi:hypothetical protein
LQEVAVGLRFLRGDRLLLTLATTLAMTNLLTRSAAYGSGLPVYTEKTSGNPADLGLMIAAFGALSRNGIPCKRRCRACLPDGRSWLLPWLSVLLVSVSLATAINYAVTRSLSASDGRTPEGAAVEEGDAAPPPDYTRYQLGRTVHGSLCAQCVERTRLLLCDELVKKCATCQGK